MSNYQESLAKDPLYRLATGAMMDGIVSSDVLAERLVREANSKNEAVLRWLNPLIESGATDEYLIELGEELFPIEVPQYRMLDRDTFRFRWALRGRMSKKAAEAFRNGGPALAIARLIDDSFTNRIRRCELADCRTYFVGDPRARWCSRRCGSTHRQRELRKRRKA